MGVPEEGSVEEEEGQVDNEISMSIDEGASKVVIGPGPIAKVNESNMSRVLSVIREVIRIFSV